MRTALLRAYLSVQGTWLTGLEHAAGQSNCDLSVGTLRVLDASTAFSLSPSPIPHPFLTPGAVIFSPNVCHRALLLSSSSTTKLAAVQETVVSETRAVPAAAEPSSSWTLSCSRTRGFGIESGRPKSS